MSWVTPDDIEAIYADFDASQEFVDHVQHLAESCAGVIAEPVSPQLRATFIDVVYRKWLAMENNPNPRNKAMTPPTRGRNNKRNVIQFFRSIPG